MVARTPPPAAREKRIAEALNPAVIREMMKKVDRCLARVEEIQHRVGSLRKSPKGRQQSLRDWRQISLPTMLVGETLQEIKQASHFAKQASSLSSVNHSKTPLSNRRPNQQNDLQHRRNREKKWKSTASPPLRKKSRALLFPSKSPEMTRSRKRSSPPHKFIVKARIRTNPPTPIRQQRPRSLSPVKLAGKLVSPLKARMTAAYNNTNQRRSSSIGTIIPPIVTKR